MARRPGRGRTGYVITIALMLTLGVILSLAGLLGIIGSLASGTGPSWGGAAGSLAILACGVLFLYEALRRDRRRRHGIDGSAIAPGRRAGRRPAMHSPVAAGLCTLILTGTAIAAIVSAVQLQGQSGTSASTQASGLHRYALIVTVHNIQHQSRSSTWYTAQIGAVLAPPVAGHTATTIWVPYRVPARTGQLIRVLVDPRQPGYSEVPGAPYVTTSQWVAQVIVAVITTGIAVLVGWATIDAERKWRRFQRVLKSPVAPGASADAAVRS